MIAGCKNGSYSGNYDGLLIREESRVWFGVMVRAPKGLNCMHLIHLRSCKRIWDACGVVSYRHLRHFRCASTTTSMGKSMSKILNCRGAMVMERFVLAYIQRSLPKMLREAE